MYAYGDKCVYVCMPICVCVCTMGALSSGEGGVMNK